MDKAIIFGVFDFVSFSLCKYLLDRGVEIAGVLLDNDEKASFFDEKRLEVGRNANFTELSFRKWAETRNDEIYGTAIFSLYDLFMSEKESVLEESIFSASILDFFQSRKKSLETVVFILPYQIATTKTNAPECEILSGFIEKIIDFCPEHQFIYLPSVYGPWQPESFLFQNSILAKLRGDKEQTGSREAREDALFIDDAVISIVNIMEENGTGRFLLESGVDNQWERCAAFLDIKAPLEEVDKVPLLENMMRICLKNSTDIEKSLSLQIEHTRRLYGLS